MSFSFTDIQFFIGGTQVGTISLTTAGVFTVDDMSGNQLGSYNLSVNETSGAITNSNDNLGPNNLVITSGGVTTTYDSISGTFKNNPTDHGGGTIHPVNQVAGNDPSWDAGGVNQEREKQREHKTGKAGRY
jgi:hypothetical protein